MFIPVRLKSHGLSMQSILHWWAVLFFFHTKSSEDYLLAHLLWFKCWMSRCDERVQASNQTSSPSASESIDSRQKQLVDLTALLCLPVSRQLFSDLLRLICPISSLEGSRKAGPYDDGDMRQCRLFSSPTWYRAHPRKVDWSRLRGYGRF